MQLPHSAMNAKSFFPRQSLPIPRSADDFAAAQLPAGVAPSAWWNKVLKHAAPVLKAAAPALLGMI